MSQQTAVVAPKGPRLSNQRPGGSRPGARRSQEGNPPSTCNKTDAEIAKALNGFWGSNQEQILDRMQSDPNREAYQMDTVDLEARHEEEKKRLEGGLVHLKTGEALVPDETEEQRKRAAETIKIFRQWDVDSSGHISRAELTTALCKLCKMTLDDVDMLMEEADQNKDGMIDYNEFLDWLAQPAGESEGRALLDFGELMRPLFETYDKDKCGAISYDEFEECHCILQGALRLRPSNADESRSDPIHLRKDAQEAFQLADRSGDRMISFLEFVGWMRSVVVDSGITMEELGELCTKLAQSLSGVVQAVQMAEDGIIGESDHAILEDVIGKLSESTRIFQEKLEAAPRAVSGGACEGWTEPPMGLSVDRLKKIHMLCHPLNMKKVKNVSWDCVCVPSPGGAANPDSRIWLGEVERKVLFSDGRALMDAPSYYAYSRPSFRWVPLDNDEELDAAFGHEGIGIEFRESLAGLSPEIQLFCILKTEANFGTELTWAQILNALEIGQDYGVITKTKVQKFHQYMESILQKMMDDHGQTTDKEVFLKKYLSLSPRMVMAILTNLQLVRCSDIWFDFLQHTPVVC